jgi:PAS domain S-box-containing protein
MTHRVLVVEDSPVQAELLRGDLATAGYDVDVASDGQEALHRVAEQRPDVIVSDVMMPEMDGYELCRQLKAHRELAAIPMILLTGLGDPIDIVRGLECGADNFITKPYERDQLLHRLDTVLRSRELAAAGRFRMGVEVLVLGHTFTVSAERQQILDMLMSSFEELVNSNDRLRDREEQLEQVRDELAAQVAVSDAQRGELEHRRDQLRQTLAQTGVVTWQVRLPDGPFEFSDNVRTVYGLSVDTDMGDLAGWLDRLVDEDRPYIETLANQLVEDPTSGLPDEWHYRLRGDDGVVRSFSARGIASFPDEDGVVASGITMDLTRRRQLEEQLRAREETLQGLLDASPDGIVVTTQDGTVRFASEAVREITGASPEDLVGEHVFQLLHEEDRVRFREIALDDGGREVRSLRIRVEHADGRVLTVDARMRPLADVNGGTDGFVTVLRDVTAQAQLETELQQARDEAEAANRAKSVYLSRMSHELRTPMNSVLGFAQLLSLSELGSEDRDSVERILAAGRHLLHLIDDVLDIARIEAGRMTVSIEPVSVEAVVSAAVELVRPQLDERRLRLTVDTASCADRHVRADHQRLSQVLINLLSNAAKYNRDEGEVSVHCSVSEDGWLRLSVSDTGPGLTAQQRSRLFTPFDRLEADRTDTQGTGLGLALCRSLVQAMHGRIGCDSTPGEGSTFFVDLPLAGGSDAATLPIAPAGAAVATQAPAAATVLYVEDNQLNFRLVERALSTWPDLRLFHAPSGEAGIELAQQAQPDVVLLDLHLPAMSGRDVLRRLRAADGTAHIPVVIISADATTTVTAELLDAGADGYLTKPIDLRRLRTTLRAVLDPDDAGAPIGGPDDRPGGG